MIKTLKPAWIAILVMVVLGCMPIYASLSGQPFYITLFSRIMIFALAAVALNLVLGFGGMVSFGHAFYLGVGAYAAGILTAEGITNGWAHLAVALVAGLAFALAIGAVALRTQGMIFIMITLAFAQMGYFLVISLKNYGGDDGLPMPTRSDFGIFNLANNVSLYYLIFCSLAATLWFFSRLIESRFGYVLRGAKSNGRRMLALGFPVFRYQLAAYVISALICVLAGFLLANLTKFASPSYMAWVVSGDLIVIIVLGGMTTLFGPVVGAIVFLLLEELLSSWKPGWFPGIEEVVNKHWLALIGVFVIVVILTAKQGLYGQLVGRRAKATTPAGGTGSANGSSGSGATGAAGHS